MMDYGKKTWAGSREGLIGRPFARIVPVGSSDTLVTAANPNRRALVLSNLDPTSLIFVQINSKAILNQGILIPPANKPVVFPSWLWGKLCEGEFRAIATLNPAPEGVSTRNSTVGNALSGAATGVKLSFQVPAGSVGILRGATAFLTNQAPTIALQIVRGVNTINLASAAANQQFATPVDLQALDTVQWNVTTQVAASTFDATISVDTFAGIVAAPATAALGVWELED